MNQDDRFNNTSRDGEIGVPESENVRKPDGNEENQTRSSTRERRATVKGKEYSRSRLLVRFTATKRGWRKQLNSLQLQLVSERDPSTLQYECRVVGDRICDLTNAQEAFELALESEQERSMLYEDHDTFARENNEILKESRKIIGDPELANCDRS